MQWFNKQARTLPWRKPYHGKDAQWRRHPYGTWISEIMLQQTQVVSVIPHYLRWMKSFPDVKSLASASESEVMRHWAGLGYYARARNVHKTAKAIEQTGKFPDSLSGWQKLSGIGPYTAGAIASLAYGLSEPIVDGNVIRILSRLFGLNFLPQNGAEERKFYWLLAGYWAQGKDPGEANESLMELGALVCLPRNPRCEACPLAADCLARLNSTQSVFPPIRPRPLTERVSGVALVIHRGKHVLMEKRNHGEFLAGHFMFPFLWGETKSGRMKGGKFVQHSIMHRRYTIEVRLMNEAPKGLNTRRRAMKWVPRTEVQRALTNSLARKIWSAVQTG